MTTETPLSAGNLPAEPNSFVGRERDLTELELLLSEIRALTLCGPGGIGKTRLALRLAARLAPQYPDGAWLAELADLDDPELVPRRVAATLGIREEPDRSLTETLGDALRSRHLLLVLDTCEHLVDACAPLVQQLLSGCRWVRVIATSREPLRVRGETVWRVPPLELPAALDRLPPEELRAHEAVRLFTDRAAAVRPGFALGPDNALTVARLCRMLDGIPLGIELAAARIRALSVEQVADRLGNRFALLASGDRTAPPRQQTLRAAVDWSYGLLTEAEQALLRRLSVFSGWNLEMAEQVCADELIPAHDVLDLLAALIDKSLVSRDSELAGDARYRLLDTIGEYARDRLTVSGEQDALRRAHRDYMLALGQSIDARAFLRGDPPWSQRIIMYHRLTIELANFRAALSVCLNRGDAEQGLRICLTLRSPWIASGDLTEGIGWLDRLLGLPAQVSPAIRARALQQRAELAFEQQDNQSARESAQAGLELFRASGEPRESAALRILALVSLREGRIDEALTSIDAAAQASNPAQDCYEAGLTLAAKGAIVTRLGRSDEAHRAFESALDILGVNNGWGVAETLYGFGAVARRRGDNEAAMRHFRDALALFRDIDARAEIAKCLAGVAWVALAQDDLELAITSLTESIQLSLATGQRLAIARGIDAFAVLVAASGDLARAVKLAGAGSALRAAVGHVASSPDRLRVAAVRETARQKLGPSAVTELTADGAKLSTFEAVACALGRDGSAGAAGGTAATAGADTAGTGPAAASAAGASLTGASTAGAGTAGASTTAGAVLGGDGGERAATDRAAMANGSPHGALNGRAGAGRPDGGVDPGSLTARELEIAGLIARGLSNRGIADELTISPATVARHVANIFGKRGFTSRSQVAAWAAEREPGASA